MLMARRMNFNWIGDMCWRMGRDSTNWSRTCLESTSETVLRALMPF